MASDGYTNLGEEWCQKNNCRQDQITRDTTIEVLLYDDSSDNISDSDDVGAITTEPTSGNYSRQTVNLDSSDVSLSLVNGDVRAVATVSFDTTNTTETVDSYGFVNDFTSDVVNSETSANTHLLAAATFGSGSKDLSNFPSSFTTDVVLDQK